MAYDIMRGQQTTRNWARGDEARAWGGGEEIMGSWLKDKLTSLATSQIPWKPIGIVAGVIAGLFFFPRLLKGLRGDDRALKHEFSQAWPDEPTVKLTKYGKLRESTKALMSRRPTA